MNLSSSQVKLLRRLRAGWIPSNDISEEDQRDLQYLHDHGLVEFGVAYDMNLARITPAGSALIDSTRRRFLRDVFMVLLGSGLTLLLERIFELF